MPHLLDLLFHYSVIKTGGKKNRPVGLSPATLNLHNSKIVCGTFYKKPGYSLLQVPGHL